MKIVVYGNLKPMQVLTALTLDYYLDFADAADLGDDESQVTGNDLD